MSAALDLYLGAQRARVENLLKDIEAIERLGTEPIPPRPERTPGPPRVVLCMPMYRTAEGPTMIYGMELAMRSAGTCGMLPLFSSGAYVEVNRNDLVKATLNTGVDWDWIFWLDSDMSFPSDALLRLMSHDLDIVGANYRTRAAPFRFAGHYLDGTDAHINESGLHEMGHLPTGMLLVRFEVFRRMPWPWFDASVDSHRDDVYFCRKARAMGYRIWCDHDLTFQMGHIGVETIPWFPPQSIVVSGAEMKWAEAEADKELHAQQLGAAINAAEHRDRDRAASMIDPPVRSAA